MDLLQAGAATLNGLAGDGGRCRYHFVDVGLVAGRDGTGDGAVVVLHLRGTCQNSSRRGPGSLVV